MRKGIGVSPGVAVGTAYCIHEIFVNPTTRRLEPQDVLAELSRFDDARRKTASDLHALYAKVQSQVGAKEAAIFRVHESILEDPSFISKIRAAVSDDHLTVETALDHVLHEFTELFSHTHDEYIKERLADVR